MVSRSDIGDLGAKFRNELMKCGYTEEDWTITLGELSDFKD